MSDSTYKIGDRVWVTDPNWPDTDYVLTGPTGRELQHTVREINGDTYILEWTTPVGRKRGGFPAGRLRVDENHRAYMRGMH